MLYAEDLDLAVDFYHDVLGLEVISFDPDRDLFLRCHGSVLIVFKASRTLIEDSVVPPHGTQGPGHLAFAATDTEIEGWKLKLKSSGVVIDREVQWKNGAVSLYFRDPAGNVLEFATPRLWGIEGQ